MKTLNTLITGIVAMTASVTVQAQNNDVRALKWMSQSPSVVEIVSLDPANTSQTELINRVNLGTGRVYIPNTLNYVKEDNSMYFFTQAESFNKDLRFGFSNPQQRLTLANSTTGEIVREIPFPNTTLVSPFVISEKAQIGFISTERTFNGYGNNDDNVSLVVFNLNTGEVAHKINLPSLSFEGVAAPFYGEVQTGGINGIGTGTMTMTSISSPCYINSSNKLLFAGRDVMGINRLYVFDLKNGTLLSQSQLDINILDMVYDHDQNVVKTLYVEDAEGDREIRVGEMNLEDAVIENSNIVRKLTAEEKIVSDGSIELDVETGSVFITKELEEVQHVYTFNSELTLTSEKTAKSEDKVDFEFTAPSGQSSAVKFGDLVKVYPNPAVDEVTVETIDLTTVTRIRVLNNVGQEVKDVLVQSGSLTNTINVAKLTTGIYMLEIHSDGAEVMMEKLIVE